MMTHDIEEILVSKEEIETICKSLGNKITNDYKHKKPLLIGLLKLYP